jgi:hypothetical protein
MLSGIEKLLKRYRTSVTPVDKPSPKRLKIAMLTPFDNPFWEGVRQGALYAKTELKSKNVDVEFLGFEVADQRYNEALQEKLTRTMTVLLFPDS